MQQREFMRRLGDAEGRATEAQMLRPALGIARAENAELQAMLANTAAELEHAEPQAAEHGRQLEEIRAKVSSAAAAQTEAEAAYAAKLASQVSELLECKSALEEARAEAAALTDSTDWPRVLTRLRATYMKQRKEGRLELGTMSGAASLCREAGAGAVLSQLQAAAATRADKVGGKRSAANQSHKEQRVVGTWFLWLESTSQRLHVVTGGVSTIARPGADMGDQLASRIGVTRPERPSRGLRATQRKSYHDELRAKLRVELGDKERPFMLWDDDYFRIFYRQKAAGLGDKRLCHQWAVSARAMRCVAIHSS